MDIFTRKDLRELMAAEGLCISVFMPTKRKGTETRQNQVRFKNLLGRAQEKLEHLRVSDDVTKSILAPAQSLLSDSRYWHFQSDGFAIFLSEGFSRMFRLPAELKELVVVGQRFHLKPLLPFTTDNMRFYVLALSQTEPVLYQCNRQQIQRIEAEGMPRSLSEVMKYEEPIKHFTMQASSTLRSGGRSTMLHGHGGATDETNDRIVQYFRQLDHGIHDLLREETAPLVLVGLDHLLPLYRQANTCPRLLDEQLVGNPKDLTEGELHRNVWDLLKNRMEKGRTEAVSRYRDLIGTGRTSAIPAELIPAAYSGRVETLFAALDQQLWGTFDPENNRVEVHQEEKPGDEDLLNYVAIHTLANGGTVHAVRQEDMPDEGILAAVFRY